MNFLQSQIPSSKPRVLFCGGAHVDRIGRSHEPVLGGASNPGVITESPGGAALNSASVFANLGGTAGLSTILGKDDLAEMVLREADNRGVEVFAQSGSRTASYTAIIEPDGNLVAGLADMAIYDTFDAENVSNVVAGLAKSDWLFLDANLPEAAILKLAETTTCRVAAATTSSAKAGRLRDALPHIDLIFTNRQQARILFDVPDKLLMTTLKTNGLPEIIVTDGKNPVLLATNGLTTELPVPQLEAVQDVTGAGDALAGAYLFALGLGKDLAQSASHGIAAAQAIVQVDGPWRSDLCTILNRPDH